jgi:predicted alpha/beta hydrolase family esterase
LVTSFYTNKGKGEYMKNAIIIHGYNNKAEYLDSTRPSPSNDHWIPWLQKQLILKGIETQTPEMPGFHEPNYEKWKEMLERFELNEDTILIGHSCGGGFLVRWLSENKQKVGKVVLVAPWLDPEKNIDPEFFNFEIDSDIASRTSQLYILYSTDDDPQIIQSINILKKKLSGATFKEFTNKGHFVLSSLKSEKFPELLELLSQ